MQGDQEPLVRARFQPVVSFLILEGAPLRAEVAGEANPNGAKSKLPITGKGQKGSLH
jgi:hypothetical protein